VVALLLWVAGSVLLRTYLSSGLRTDTGPVAAPIAVLIFFFVTALAVLIGAEVNATTDAMWPDRVTQNARRDAGQRQRRAAAGGGRGGAAAWLRTGAPRTAAWTS
jgi:membrane protein